MKRDFDLMRKILLAVEKFETWRNIKPIQLEGIDSTSLGYNVHLLQQAGLVAGGGISDDGKSATATGLTWAGHEFLDLARDDFRFKNAMEHCEANVGGVSFEVLKRLLAKWAINE